MLSAFRILEKLKIKAADPRVYEFLDEFLAKNIKHREQTGTKRNDFLQLLLNLYQEDKIKYREILGNTFLFYIAGSETSSALASFCLDELCRRPEVMQKLVADIDEVLAKHNGQIDYDSIKEMKYLDMCTRETLRKVPGLPILNRICTKDYRVTGTEYVISKGTTVILPVLSLQMDSEYFPDPDKFIPERFDVRDDNPLRYNQNAYFPFGDGPRACIAIRMGIMVAKVALVYTLSRYRCEATTSAKLEFDNYAVGLMPKGGISIRLTKRAAAQSS